MSLTKNRNQRRKAKVNGVKLEKITRSLTLITMSCWEISKTVLFETFLEGSSGMSSMWKGAGTALLLLTLVLCSV
jgi:hypothetical protein